MSTVLGLAPLFVATVAVVVVLAAPHSRYAGATVTRVARRYFGRYVPADAPERRRQLRAAYVDETYRSYAAKTYLLTAVAALTGAVVGVYGVGGLLVALPSIGAFVDQLPNAIANALGRPELDPSLTERQVLAVVTVGGVATGTLVAGATYWYRWERPRSRAEVRRRGINEGLPRTVAFVYALSRGGMAVPEVMRTVARNREVYGHGADEITIAVREMDMFGRDVVTAVRRVSERTPSDQFKTFSENLASVLQSGQNLPDFLRAQYERYREDAEDRQEEVLERLATIAEAYVTILVAGTLFLMTILLVFGLTTTRTIAFLRLMAYVLIPLANVLFVLYLAGKLQLLGVGRGSDTGVLRAAIDDRRPTVEPDRRAADGGRTAGDVNRGQLAAYDSVRRLKGVVDRPLRTLLERPTSVLYVTVPLAALSVAIRAPSAFGNGGVLVRTLDDVLVQAVLLVVGSFAVTWELYRRRIARMEAALPELLDRLASLNDAGMSVVEAFERVRESDLGTLSVEVERVWRDLEYGANVDDALRRFGLRVRTTATTRVVTLLTNALRASGNVAPVLRIASQQATAEMRLRRKRRQQMLTYLVVIYISFLVFLVIIVAVQEVLVPSLPNNVPTPDTAGRLGVDAGQFARFGQVDKAAYTLVFFHTALVQAVMSGFIGGQLGEGSLKDGAKHATVMLGVAYVAFLLLSSPVAQVTFADQETTGEAVVVDSVSLSEGGFVTIRARSADGEVIGHSGYLRAGTHTDVRIPIDGTYADEMELYAMPHRDANGDEQLDFGAADSTDSPYPSERTRVHDVAAVTRSDAPSALDRVGSVLDRAESVAGRPGPATVAGAGGAASDSSAAEPSGAGRPAVSSF